MTKKQPDTHLLEIEEILPILNKIALFGGLNDKQLYTIFSILRTTHYGKGEFIFEEGDSPDDIYIVQKGSVEIILDAKESRLAEKVFTVGQCFGEISVIGIIPHTASAMVKEDTELIILSRQALFSLWDTDKELFAMIVLNIAREACRRLNQSNEILLQYFAQK